MADAGSLHPVADTVRRLRDSPTAIPVGLVVAMLVGVELFPNRMPGAVYLSGVVFGIWTALVALAVVLVFTSNRIVNFAAYQVGGTAAVLFGETVSHHLIARVLIWEFDDKDPSFPAWAITTEYWLAAVLCVLLAAGLSALTYVVVVRRLRDAPPLVGTVATIAVSVLLLAGTEILVRKAFESEQLTGDTAPPQDVSFSWGGNVFHLPAIATLVVGIVAVPLVWLFLRRSKVGTGVRAAAANSERAATLGLDGSRITTAVWVIAGALSGFSALLTVATTGPGSVGGVNALVRVLAAVVLAATVHRWLAFSAAVAIGVLQQGLLWSFGRGELADAAVFVLVAVVLLLRRGRAGARVDVTDSSWRAAREVRPVPPELQGHPDVRRLRRRVLVGVGLVAVGYPFLMPTGRIGTGTIALIYGMVALSLLVLTGWAGLISLGQFAFAAAGGWVTAVLTGRYGLSPLVALPAAALAGGLLALVVGAPALRIRGLYLAIVTLAFAVLVSGLLLNPKYGGRALPDRLGRPGVLGLATDDERAFYFFCLVLTAAATAAVAGLRRSRSARALIASRDNERAAEMFGVDLVRARLQAFVLSGVIASLAGGLFAFQQQSVDPGNFSPAISLTVFLIVVVGGLGSIAGPLLGAAFYGALELMPLSDYAPLALPIAVLVVLVTAPGGLTQMVFTARDAILRRIAIRHRIVVPSLVDPEHPGWRSDAKVALAPAAGPVPTTYALPHAPLTVPSVAATGKGA